MTERAIVYTAHPVWDVNVLTTLQALMSLNVNTNELLRVSINPHGRFDIVDFTTPRQGGRFLHKDAPQEDIPAWIIETISILRITEPRSVVDGIGFKVHDRLYYIVEKRGNHEEN